MNENISLKMGQKCAASLNLVKNSCKVLNIIINENGENELRST